MRKRGDYEYKDFMSLPGGDVRAMFTLYPSYTNLHGNIYKNGEDSTDPLMLISLQDTDGQVLADAQLPLGGQTVLGYYHFTFDGLRRWSSFAVSDEPGHGIVYTGLALGIFALVLRYLPVIWSWKND